VKQALLRLFAPAPNTTMLVVCIAAGVAGSVLLLLLLHHTLGSRGRRRVMVAATFLGGLFYGLEYFLPARGKPSENLLTPFIEPAGVITSVVLAFTVGLGIYSLCQVHGRTIFQRRKGWFNSVAFFLAMAAMFATGMLARTEKQGGLATSAHEVLFGGLYVPLQAATFSLLAFYIASAAYRAFRIRTFEASLMMLSAFVVMLGQVPAGSWLTSSLPPDGAAAFFRLENLGTWIMLRLNTPAQRAIIFGITVGALAMSLRVWLSLERGTFFSEKS
jgi:hypothetical protein